jgi:single-stranded-DNA-specific exonuclease
MISCAAAMKWTVKAKPVETEAKKRFDEIKSFLLNERQLFGSADIENYFSPRSPIDKDPESVGIDPSQLNQAINIIEKTIAAKTPIIVYGDYDADGITATAILWETLFRKGAIAYPFIPCRHDHGYGLSIKGLKDAINHLKENNKPLIITVDNGIVAHEAATYLQQENIPLIITDHHQKGDQIPPHLALVHSDQIAGSAVSWFLAKALLPEVAADTLDLVTIGTVADMLPLTDFNRELVKSGLVSLKNTSRPGIKAIFAEAGVGSDQELSTYHINFIIAPRLNAMGRLEHALDSLRLLCTRNPDRANQLAHKLTLTNSERQDLTVKYIELAEQSLVDPNQPILIIDHEDFHEGIIGLVAGKLCEKYHRPCIVIHRGQTVSKASARSVNGVNIIELIRQHESHLVNAGGHPLAAGFTLETENISKFHQDLIATATKTIDPSILVPMLKINLQLIPEDISWELHELLEEFKPFGIGNAKPVFSIHGTRLANASTVGKQKQHLRLRLQNDQGTTLDGIGFNLGNKLDELSQAAQVDTAFTLEENNWNGKRSLQIHVKDIKPSE